MSRPVWLDADPGFDDLVTWLMLDTAPEVDLLGVSVVAGNAPLPFTLANACRARDFFGLPQRVYAGRARPLAGPQVTSQHLLGERGLSSLGRTLPDSPYAGEDESGVQALLTAASAHPGALTVVAIGPLTNLAAALMLEPRLPGLLREVVWMGGSTDRGNHTAAAEFNAYADPEAAEVVLGSGVPFTLVGLNLTRQVLVTPEDLREIRGWASDEAGLLADHLAFYLGLRTPGTPGPMPWHDPCAALWLLCPEAFAAAPAEVHLELTGVRTRGMTVCEFRVPGRGSANARVVTQADAGRCREVWLGLLRRRLSRAG